MSSELDGNSKAKAGIIAVKQIIYVPSIEETTEVGTLIIKPPTQTIYVPSIEETARLGVHHSLTAHAAAESRTSDAMLEVHRSLTAHAHAKSRTSVANIVINEPSFLRWVTLENRLKHACQVLMLPTESTMAQYKLLSITEFETVVARVESLASWLKERPQDVSLIFVVAHIHIGGQIWQPGAERGVLPFPTSPQTLDRLIEALPGEPGSEIWWEKLNEAYNDKEVLRRINITQERVSQITGIPERTVKRKLKKLA